MSAQHTSRQIDILRHALGLKPDGSGRVHRAHFVTGPGSDDFDDCEALVAAGSMSKRNGSQLSGGDPIYLVTDSGAAIAKAGAVVPAATKMQALWDAHRELTALHNRLHAAGCQAVCDKLATALRSVSASFAAEQKRVDKSTTATPDLNVQTLNEIGVEFHARIAGRVSGAAS